MNDLKLIKRLIISTFLMIGILASVQNSRAVIIEGFDDAGTFVSVAVTADGRLKVANDSGDVAQVIVFGSSQPVNAFQASTPWIVSPVGGSDWTTVQKAGEVFDVDCVTGCGGGGGGGDVTTTPSTTTAAAYGQAVLTGGVSVNVSSVDADLRQRLFCNVSAATTWVGFDAGVTDTTGLLIGPGACYSPDNPITYSGDVHFYSTSAARVAWQEIRKP